MVTSSVWDKNNLVWLTALNRMSKNVWWMVNLCNWFSPRVWAWSASRWVWPMRIEAQGSWLDPSSCPIGGLVVGMGRGRGWRIMGVVTDWGWFHGVGVVWWAWPESPRSPCFVPAGILWRVVAGCGSGRGQWLGWLPGCGGCWGGCGHWRGALVSFLAPISSPLEGCW